MKTVLKGTVGGIRIDLTQEIQDEDLKEFVHMVMEVAMKRAKELQEEIKKEYDKEYE
jgi:hypothetical protein